MDFEALLNQPFRWPKAGDQLFQVSPDWDGNACVAAHPHSRMVMMMSGYKRGADLMVAQAVQSRPDRDSLVFPIIFNYRQYLELSLKYLISSYGLTVGVDPIWISTIWPSFGDAFHRCSIDMAQPMTTGRRPLSTRLSANSPRSIRTRFPFAIRSTLRAAPSN